MPSFIPGRGEQAGLRLVTMTRAATFIGSTMRQAILPRGVARFQAGVPEAERDGDLVAAYNQVLNEHPDPAIRARAAKKVRLGGRHRFARGGVDPQSPLHEHGLPNLGPGHHISGSTEQSAGSTKTAPV